MKRGFLYLTLAFLTANCYAQHCPWDGSSFIMVDVKANPGEKLQKIYLLDSNGARVTSKHYFGQDKFETDTAKFWKNKPPVVKNTKWSYTGQYFSFAKNYQVLSFGQYNNTMSYSLLVIYESAKKVKSRIISIPATDIHVLCTLNKELWGGKRNPVAITL